MGTDAELTWEAPGPGYWEWQGSHLPGIPTPIYREVWANGLNVGVSRCFERIGVPLAGLEPQFVNDRAFTSLAAAGGQARGRPASEAADVAGPAGAPGVPATGQDGCPHARGADVAGPHR